MEEKCMERLYYGVYQRKAGGILAQTWTGGLCVQSDAGGQAAAAAAGETGGAGEGLERTWINIRTCTGPRDPHNGAPSTPASLSYLHYHQHINYVSNMTISNPDIFSRLKQHPIQGETPLYNSTFQSVFERTK